MSIDPLKIVLLLIQPLSLTLLLALAAAVFGHWLLRALAIVAVLLTLALSTPWVAEWLAQPLEQRFASQPPQDYGAYQAIVLLGGGVRAGDAVTRSTDATAGADRMHLAAKLWHAERAPEVIVTGGDGSDWTEAHAMRAWLIDLGVAPEAITLEPTARNTRQHPERVWPLLDAPQEPFLLVTSALHMPRSVARFRAAGMQPLAAPADHELLLHGDARDLLPATLALDRSTRAFKENLGLLHLRVVGGWAR